MSVVRIKDRIDARTPDGDLLGFWLDKPTPGTESGVYSIPLQGWVVTRGSPAQMLEITRENVCVDQLPIGTARPDIAEIYPDIPWAGESGFDFELGALTLPPEFTLHVAAVLEDGTRVSLATLFGSRRMPADEASETIQPLMVTTLGRTGSTWVLTMLSGHPEIVAYPPYESEVRVASYWTDVFLALGEPASYRQSVAALIESPDWWLGSPRRADDGFACPDVLEFLGGEQIDELKTFCKRRIEAFYERFTPTSDGRPARYFAEKRLISYRRQIHALRELFPATREIFLVRDFRDMVASIFAFSKRKGVVHGFGRAEVDSDLDYVRERLAGGVLDLAHAWRERAEWAHVVRYEDLVLRPRETLRSLLGYLDLDANDDQIERMLAAGAKKSERQSMHRTTATASDSVGRWRTDLSPELAEACESAFGEALETFGYGIRRDPQLDAAR